jgi:hypothetical protein
MIYIITSVTATGRTTYTAIGDRNALMDAAYNQPGVLGVSVIART